MIELPNDFKEKMKILLKEEYKKFIESYNDPKTQGLRVNTLKIACKDFEKISPFSLKKVSWAEEGFYHEVDKPGKHPYHEAGLYYIQEPSAMAVGALLDPQPGERILDLCAAPGGKSTHIAAKLKGEGLLVSNEVYPARSKILSQNIERLGIKNCIVTNESPARLSKKFKNYFHRILVDAPCSGEGMFRKDPDTCKEWSIDNVSMCAERQLDILEQAQKMLMPEGILVYSTCTFSPEENEGVIEKFIKNYPEFYIEAVKTYDGFAKGRPEWILSDDEDLKKAIRLWPHQLRGEGHFIAVLKKRDGEVAKIKNKKKQIDKKALKDYYDFGKKYLNKIPEGKFIVFGEQLYILPEDTINLENLKVIRPGLHLGTLKKNRFEPSHAFALSLKPEDVKNNIFMDAMSQDIIAYLKGESISFEGKNGWNLVNVDGYSIGWCKIVNNILKNHYPKGLRWVGQI
ncbi:RsmF rRNA methyltransferase first C-terminal domain-containing protein [Crassaminicella indica]|uniref:RsmF rRNA methyltransferase first C-terminal domain-containing protein n=1 Tax=Crassaminicella indica TaxID=2855394 RepID=A0ABX8RAG5_9CLOT|nr:RsmF rRNA methyltransferase first C-terminal domain-containing protein [Crassaminicella indica]QXM05454.1 RsmF rRNA methyltransferase first C-terminal domain-containing protein [Crassaminicella indica]